MAKCVYPITIGKQSGLTRWKVVPCGKCLTCRRRRQAAWSFRLLHEMQHSTSAAFLTLTYSDENLTYGDGVPTLVKRDFQLFMKRLRKAHERKLVYYACGEYGTKTQRPHYHAIMFNLEPKYMLDQTLAPFWKLGHVRVDACNIKTIQYVTKYVMKGDYTPDQTREPEFSLMSKGIGKKFLTNGMVKYYQEDPKNYVVWQDGKKLSMPRYYKEKLYDEDTQRRLGNEALELVVPEQLDSTKRFEIKQNNKKLKKIQHEKRSKV